MAKGDWVSVTREHPCPICGKPDNCKVARDGGAVWCGRVDQGSVRQNAGGQFLHVIRDRADDRGRDGSPPWPRRSDHKPKNEPKWPTAKTDEEKGASSPPRNWEITALAAFDNPPAEEKRQELATSLGVDVEALRRLGVGWNCHGWTIPERNGDGKIIGINVRHADGTKRRRAGGAMGLSFDPESWMTSATEPGFVFLVEGASDTAAMMSMGLSVVGRPSNTGGVELLAKLLRSVPKERLIVVVGERDRKPNESLSQSVREWHKATCEGCCQCWPGRFGAITTATQLARALERPIAWAFPPDGAKDSRAWLNSQAAERGSE